MSRTVPARRRLEALLVAAYSGEQAAALAYGGHWRSSAAPDERERIRQIEDDEWRHRRIVGWMLERLGAAPSLTRELRSRVVGRALGALCPLAGWLLPMYGARLLERSNVCSYDEAASLAGEAGLPELVGELREMAEVEREHERYFAERIGSRSRRLSAWPPAGQPCATGGGSRGSVVAAAGSR